MRLVRIWIGVVLLVFGVLGVLGAAGVMDASTLLDRWWPVAVIGLGAAAMIAQRRVSVGPLLISVVGLVLLADVQNWTDDSLFWPAVFILVSALVLAGLGRRHIDHQMGQPVAIFGGVEVADKPK